MPLARVATPDPQLVLLFLQPPHRCACGRSPRTRDRSCGRRTPARRTPRPARRLRTARARSRDPRSARGTLRRVHRARAKASVFLRGLNRVRNHRARDPPAPLRCAGRRRAGRDRTSATRCRRSPSSCRPSPARGARRSRWAGAASPAGTRRGRSAARRSRRRRIISRACCTSGLPR